MNPVATPHLVVRSQPADVSASLLDHLPSDGALAWIRRGDGIAGWGEAARLDVAGSNRFAEAQRWWSELTGAAVVRDDIDVPGSGLVCFGSFGFTDDDPGVLVVPQVVVGRRGSATWVTTISPASTLPAPPELSRYEPESAGQVTFADGARSGAEWSAIVLAGTIRRTGDDEHDLALAASLARSSKDLEEHEFAVRSVAEALQEHCQSMLVPESPFVLHLPNVMHLATDVSGVAANGASALGLAAALHPSAAICGTPTAVARDLIAELEGMSRGRYSGPVGWLDASGDGEWGIALRCGQADPDEPSRMRLFAGCGIVAGSDPAAELAESNAKLVPMRDALGT